MKQPGIRLENAIHWARERLQDKQLDEAEIWVARAQDDLRECQVELRDLELQLKEAQQPTRKPVQRED
jgi:hypothetical protein